MWFKVRGTGIHNTVVTEGEGGGSGSRGAMVILWIFVAKYSHNHCPLIGLKDDEVGGATALGLFVNISMFYQNVKPSVA